MKRRNALVLGAIKPATRQRQLSLPAASWGPISGTVLAVCYLQKGFGSTSAKPLATA